MSGSPRALSYHISALWRVSLTSQLFNQQILLVVALRCSARWPLLRPLTLRSFSILPHTRSPQAKYPSSSCVRQPGSPLLDWAIIRFWKWTQGQLRSKFISPFTIQIKNNVVFSLFGSAAALSSLFCPAPLPRPGWVLWW